MKRISTIAVAALLALAAQAQEARIAEDLAFFKQHIKTLASDEFGGRKPMSEYEPKTINYIAEQFRAIGLQPGWNGSYLQPVREISTLTRPVGGKLTVRGKKSVNLTFGDDVVVWTHRNASSVDIANAEMVFCGFGIDAPEYDWSDFDGMDVKGKIILAMVNDPGFYNADLFRGRNMTYYGRWTYKLEEAERRGALGCLVIHNTAAASYGFQVCRSSHIQTNISLLSEDDNASALGMCGWIQEDAVRSIFAACGKDYDTAAEEAKKPGFKPYSLGAKMKGKLDVKVEIGESHNVIGVLPGTDLKDECIVMTAHWDHFGIGEPVNGDNIYNGASDNASGVAGIMLQARMFMRSPIAPRRSLVFVAVTSEECGLLGSEWYCEHPAFPLSKTAANINVDGGAPQERTWDISLQAAGKSDLDNLVVAAAAAQGKYVKVRTQDPGGMYFRTDHFNFCKKGIPGILAGPGNDYVDKAHHDAKPKVNSYHQPNDEYDEATWEFDGAMENVNFLHSIIFMIANQDEMPKWAPNADFQRMAD